MALYVQSFKYGFAQEIAPILKHGLDSSVDTVLAIKIPLKSMYLLWLPQYH